MTGRYANAISHSALPAEAEARVKAYIASGAECTQLLCVASRAGHDPRYRAEN